MPDAALPTVDVELENLIRARYPLIYIVSWEERRVEETIREVCQRRGKKMLVWTFTTGMAGNLASKDPIAALDYVINAPDQSVFVLKDFHPFITDVAVTRRLRDLVYALKQSYKTVILLSPLLKLPPELEKEITVVDYQLPTLSDIDRLLESVIQSVRGDNRISVALTALEREQIIKAASGLTSIEAENVFAKSLVQKRRFDVDVILGEKEQIIRKSGILEYYRASDSFNDVGGMDLLKNWMGQRTTSFNEDAKKYGLPEPKGILLLGVQGCGKSLIAKSLASLWKLPLLRLDVGKIFAGIVGSSEENMRKAIATAESVAPCVAGDTRITLVDGSEKTIADLYEGNQAEMTVWGMNETFEQVPVHVKAITRREAPDLFTVQTRHTQLQATSNHLHPVLRNGKLDWTRTDALQVGDAIAMPNDEINTTDVKTSVTVSVERAETPEFVYDLVCDAPHTFIANGLYTHNCLLWLDELEKGFAGTQSSPFSDGGTTSRVFGTFIGWLQDKKAPCFVVATSNDVSQLPPELIRKGRFDEIFFVDLPAMPERREIFAIHLRKRGRDVAHFDLDRLAKLAAGYSGAEIEQVVVSALFTAYSDNKREVGTDDLMQAMRESVPLSVTMQEGIQKLRDWASTRARPSSSTTVEPMEEWAETQEFMAMEQARSGGGSFYVPPVNVLPHPGDPMQAYAIDDTDDIEADAASEFNALAAHLSANDARISALESKTSTGMDTLMGESQNLDALKRRVPKPPDGNGGA